MFKIYFTVLAFLTLPFGALANPEGKRASSEAFNASSSLQLSARNLVALCQQDAHEQEPTLPWSTGRNLFKTATIEYPSKYHIDIAVQTQRESSTSQPMVFKCRFEKNKSQYFLIPEHSGLVAR